VGIADYLLKAGETDPHVLVTWVKEIDGYSMLCAQHLGPTELVSVVKKIG
jgi:hypothetical protein